MSLDPQIVKIDNLEEYETKFSEHKSVIIDKELEGEIDHIIRVKIITSISKLMFFP